MKLQILPMSRAAVLGSFCMVLAACQSLDRPSYARHVVDNAMAGGYGLEIADIDGDGLLDIVALATNPAQFVWYRNPSWDKHLITANSRGDIAAAAQDIDGDGDIDLVLASEFSLAESTQGGLRTRVIQRRTRNGRPIRSTAYPRRIDCVGEILMVRALA